MDNTRFLIPKHLDAPPMFLIWEFDTVAIFLVFATVGMIVNENVIFLSVGGIIARYYARTKGHGGFAVIIHVVYWYTSLLSRVRMPSHRRVYIG